VTGTLEEWLPPVIGQEQNPAYRSSLVPHPGILLGEKNRTGDFDLFLFCAWGLFGQLHKRGDISFAQGRVHCLSSFSLPGLWLHPFLVG